MTIVLTWLIQCLLIAAVLAAAAASWELAARWSGRPARWAWLGALAGSVALPWLLRLLPAPAALPTIPMALPVLALDPIVAGATTSSPGWSVLEMSLAAWAVLSMLAVAYVVCVVVHLARARRGWHARVVDGERVYVTRNTGPAALGVRDAMVIIPSWVLELDAELRGLLLRHEREHVNAGDPKLLLTGLVLVAVMPWNPVLWLQLLRLRNAIELDCDSRVLAGGADPERYGSLLLEVGRRRAGSALVMATFAEPRVFLRERIRRIAKWPLERRRGRSWLFGVLALALCVTALSARDPLRSRVDDVASVADVESTATLAAERGSMVSDTPPAPYFTPMTVAPELQNREAVRSALEQSYPPALRDAGIGGRPTVWLYIDTLGVVQATRLEVRSGHALLDEAALTVAGMMRFTSALNQGRRVAVWIELPIIFNPPGIQAVSPARRPEPVARPTPAQSQPQPQPPQQTRPQPQQPQSQQPRQAQPQQPRQAQPQQPRPQSPPQSQQPQSMASPGAGASTAPYFTPMTVAPELANREVVVAALQSNYPPMLREAGIGGRARVWFHINQDGTVQSTRLSRTSGHTALDEAALRVASSMVFSPALNHGERVAVWVELPIIFTAR